MIPTGLAVSIPRGFEAQIRPRSGLALYHGIGMVNSPGTIDSDYRGEIGIVMINWGTKPFAVNRGDRIAQMVITNVARAVLVAVGFGLILRVISVTTPRVPSEPTKSRVRS